MLFSTSCALPRGCCCSLNLQPRFVLFCRYSRHSPAALVSGDPVIAGRCFEVVVVDEATQATEPAALVATAARVRLLAVFAWIQHVFTHNF